MPLYEFYCARCHAVYTFRSLCVDTVTVPACPECDAPLKREVSLFSAIRARGSTDGFDSDELAAAKEEELIADMTNCMERLEGEECEASQAVRMMRKMAEREGRTFSREVEEAFARIEAGEDAEKIGEEFDEIFAGTHNPFADAEDGVCGEDSHAREMLRLLSPPRRVKEWYDMPGQEA